MAPPPPPPVPAAAPMTRAPSTYGDPGNAGGAPQAGQPNVMSKLAEIDTAVLGIARTQNMMFNLLLNLAVNQLGIQKDQLAQMLIQHAQNGEPEKFFSVQAQQGKAG